MTSHTRDVVLKELGALFDEGILANLTDGELLERFVSRTGEISEQAFAVLVGRHGPMVFRVCGNVLKDPHDVDDAFQATFMILVRKAGSIRKRASCGSWLHGVALRAAAGIRSAAARRRELERKIAQNSRECAPVQAPEIPDDLRGVIDEEINRLGDHHSAALVLCYLEGRTCEEAARQLGWPVGTVKSRLARARERMRRQLARRGVGPSLAAAGTVGVPSLAKSIVPASLESRIVAEGVRLAAQGARTAALPAAIAALVRHEVTRETTARVIRMGALLLLGLGLAFATAVPRPTAPVVASAPLAPEPERPKSGAGPVHARVVDLQGKAVAGVAVLVFGRAEPTTTVKTDPDGRLVLGPEPTREWFGLLARRDNTVGWASYSRSVPGQGGTADEPLELVLTPVTHKVAGSVLDLQRRPLAGVRIAVCSLGLNAHPLLAFSGSGLAREDFPLGSCVTDANGRYMLTVPADTDICLATLDRRYVGRRIVVYDDVETAEPAVLQQAGRISGSIRDAATGSPVAGARLEAQFLDDNLYRGEAGEAVSNAQGKFSMEGLVTGVYNVTVSHVPGRTRATARAVVGIRVRADEDSPADLEVFDGIPLKGVLIDFTTRKPMPEHFVRCSGPAHPFPGAEATQTDERGQFTFFVPPGEHTVSEISADTAARGSRLGLTTVDVREDGKVPPIRLVGPYPDRTSVVPSMVPVTTRKAPSTTARASASKATKVRVSPVFVNPKPIRGRTVIGQVVDSDGRPLAGVAVHFAIRIGFDLQLVSWGDGSGVPRSGYNLVIFGADTMNRLHIRIFDADGDRITDADETTLPASKAGPISALKRQLQELSPPHGMTTQERQQILRAAASIADRELAMEYGSRLVGVSSDRQGIFIATGVPPSEVTFTAIRYTGRRPSQQLSEIVPAERESVEFTFGPALDRGIAGNGAPTSDERVPPSLADRLTFVDLDPTANEFLADGPGGGGDDLNRLAHGIHAFDQTFYRIGERLIHIQGRAVPGVPDNVAGVTAGARGDRIHFLHSARGDVPPGTEIAFYTVNFADGTTERVPVAYGREVGSWTSSKGLLRMAPSRARVAWSGSNDDVERGRGSETKIHLFAFTWQNPHPERVITKIDAKATSMKCELVIVGITLERGTAR